LKRLSLFIVFFICTTNILADDPGITKARLIQLSDTSYILEADVSQPLIWAIKAAIFPDRFEVSEVEYEKKAGWMVARVFATTQGAPLSAEDQILLPWLRNGADLTAQWKDGTISKALFIRTIDGIHVPLSQLMVVEKSDLDILKEYFVIGLRHSIFHGIHLVFVFAVFLMLPNKQALKYLLWYSLGQGLSLILVDLNMPGFDLTFVELLGLIIVFLVSTRIIISNKATYYIPLFLLYGLLHGLGYNVEISGNAPAPEQQLQALFAFSLAVEVLHFSFALVLIFAFGNKTISNKLAYVPGVLSVFLIILLIQALSKSDQIELLSVSKQGNSTQYALPVSQASQSGDVKNGARQLTTPIMNYVSIEPHEVRLEILIKARTAVQILGIEDRGMGSIPIPSLKPVKNRLLTALIKNNEIIIDNKNVQPILSRADFVSLSAAGVLLRESPRIESLDNGIIGITLVYETSGLAEDISMTWNVFPPKPSEIETTINDPFGGAIEVLSASNNEINWKKKLSGYLVPVVEQVEYEKPRIPLLAILIFASVLLLYLIPKTRHQKHTMAILATMGFVIYPFVIIQTNLPLADQFKPSTEQATIILDKLLTNVYRSFDVRNEDEVYDRLATSVEGDQLTEIYIQNRQSMELEYRGGARAKVEELEIQDITNTAKAENGDFVTEVSWMVGGSVNHFGHTHYRRNLNHAIVTFGIVDSNWKIKKIELLDERRII